jgi:hypothetical protein
MELALLLPPELWEKIFGFLVRGDWVDEVAPRGAARSHRHRTRSGSQDA